MVKLNEIDFAYFIGQVVKDVNTKENSTFIKKILLSKRIINKSLYEDLLFIIEFEDNLSLELFHASCYFEGRTLQGENGLDIWTLPGGTVCY
jgi:hypothetical protein